MKNSRYNIDVKIQLTNISQQKSVDIRTFYPSDFYIYFARLLFPLSLSLSLSR